MAALPSHLLAPFLPLAKADVVATGEVSEFGQATPGLTPWVILLFCVLAAVATVLLLPGGRKVAWTRLGGGLLLVAGLLLGITLFLQAGYHNVYFWAFTAIALFGSARVVTHPQPVYSALYFVLTVFASAGLFVLAYAEFIAVALVTIYAGAILVTYTFVIMLAADAAPEETGVVGREQAAKDFLAEHDAKARTPIAASLIGFATAGVLLFVIFDKAPQRLEKRLSLVDAAYLQQSNAELRQTELDAQAVTSDEVEADAEDEAEDEAVHGITAADTALVPGATPVRATETRGLAIAPQPDEMGLLAGPLRGDLYTYENRLAYAQEQDRGGIQVLGVYLFTRQMVALQVAGLILTVAMIGAIVIARRQIIPELLPGGRRKLDSQAEEETMTMPFTPVNDNPKSLPVVSSATARQKAYPQN